MKLWNYGSYGDCGAMGIMDSSWNILSYGTIWTTTYVQMLACPPKIGNISHKLEIHEVSYKVRNLVNFESYI